MTKIKKIKINPDKIFFKYKCVDCSFIIEQPILDSGEIGEPFCSNCGSEYVKYISTFMLVNYHVTPKKKRTKNTTY